MAGAGSSDQAGTGSAPMLSETNSNSTEASVGALDLARDLIAHGIPVVVCPPTPGWAPGAKNRHTGQQEGEFRWPQGWNVITAEKCDISGYRPGVDALAMVSGHGVDVVDVDTKAGGRVENLPPFRFFGVHRTPSGGAHYLVRSTGIGKISPLTTSAGHVGDYAGGTPDGRSRMLVYLPGSTRPKYPDKGYTIGTRVDLDELLEHDPDDDLVNALEHLGGTREGTPGRRAASHPEALKFLADHDVPLVDPCSYGRSAVKNLLATAAGVVPGDPVPGRHAWTVRTVTRLVELIRAGCANSADLREVEAKLDEIKPEGGTDFLGVLAWAITNAKGTVECGKHRPVVPEHAGGSLDRAPLDALLDHLRTWQDGTDLSHVKFALAVAVSAAHAAGEPLWGMIVGPPSSGKTEAVRLLDAVTDDRADELTAAALLSWTKGKTPRATGVLTRIPNPALLTVADFSTVLATSNRGGRDQLFALLRRVYDGRVTRDLGNAESRLEWEGHLTILAAVTPAIDEYSTHSDALGPRWLYLRMPDVEPEVRRQAAARTTVDLLEKRSTARRLAADVVRQARSRLPSIELEPGTLRALGDAAVVVAAARGAVPRDGYGRREIIGMPVKEEPHRLVGQLQLLTRALLALGLSSVEAQQLALRAALDTVPSARRAVLQTLTAGEVHTVSSLASAARLNRKVAKLALEELRELGLACCPVEDEADVDDLNDLRTQRRNWQLALGLGDLAAAVVASSARGT